MTPNAVRIFFLQQHNRLSAASVHRGKLIKVYITIYQYTWNYYLQFSSEAVHVYILLGVQQDLIFISLLGLY